MQRARRQLPFFLHSKGSDRIAAPCPVNDKESKQDPCKQQSQRLGQWRGLKQNPLCRMGGCRLEAAGAIRQPRKISEF